MKNLFRSVIIMLTLFILIILVSCQVKLADNITLPSSTPIPTPTPSNLNTSPVIIDSLGQVEFRKILNGDKSNIRNYDVRVAENEGAFQKLWDDHTGSQTNPLFLPKVDFQLKNVVAIFLGDRPTTGYDVNIKKIDETKDKIIVYLEEIKPLPGEEVKADITQPFLIIEIKKSNKIIDFENSLISKSKVEDVNFQSLELGSDSSINLFSKKLAKNEKEFSSLYQEHILNKKEINSSVFPFIDFKKNMVAGVFLGERSSTGYSIEIKSVVKTDSQIIITARETPPSSLNNIISIVTTPYHMITLPQSDLPVKFDIDIIVPIDEKVAGNEAPSINKNKEIILKPLVSGDSSNISISQYKLIKNREDYKNLWAEHTNSKDSIPPDVNFDKNSLIAIFIGKKETSGYNVNINSAIETEEDLKVFVEIIKDKNNNLNVSTSPFELVLIPKTNKPASFIINNLVKE